MIRDLIILFIHLIGTVFRLSRPGSARSVIAESLLLKHQLIVLNRPRQRAPVLRPQDRIIVGLCATFIRPTRLLRSAIVLRPSTILSFHRALVKRKYRELFSPKIHGKPGPKGPSAEVISAIVEMKRRNPGFGYQRIADQIDLVFEIEIDKDVVRRALANHYRPEPGSGGASWLTFLGHTKDSLWSIDLFRCESPGKRGAVLRTDAHNHTYRFCHLNLPVLLIILGQHLQPILDIFQYLLFEFAACQRTVVENSCRTSAPAPESGPLAARLPKVD